MNYQNNINIPNQYYQQNTMFQPFINPMPMMQPMNMIQGPINPNMTQYQGIERNNNQQLNMNNIQNLNQNQSTNINVEFLFNQGKNYKITIQVTSDSTIKKMIEKFKIKLGDGNFIFNKYSINNEREIDPNSNQTLNELGITEDIQIMIS